jgi:hypothetical protein
MNPCNDKVAHLKYAHSMKVLLVSMPWAAVDSPSLALGILKREISGLDGVEVSTVYANIDYLDWMSARSPFRSGETIHLFGYRDYMYFSVGTATGYSPRPCTVFPRGGFRNSVSN